MDRPLKEELELLRKTNSNTQIAEKYGMSVSTVKRWIAQHQIERRATRRSTVDPYRQIAIDMGIIRVYEVDRVPSPPVDSDISLMDRCRQILGPRMGEDHRGYLLDGRPASSAQVIKAAGLTINL